MKLSKAKLFLLLFAVIALVTVLSACQIPGLSPLVTTTEPVTTAPAVTTAPGGTTASATTTAPAATTTVPSATTTAPGGTTAPGATIPETPANPFRFEEQEDGTYKITDYTGNEETVSIPAVYNGKAVTAIGEHAFEGCTGLTSITIPDSVESIGWCAFWGCTGLEAVYITDLAAWCEIEFDGQDSNPLYYAGMLYWNGSLITNLVIPNGTTKIGNRAFYNCTGLQNIVIPDSVETIGERAFYGCSGLTSVTIGSGVETIGSYAFEYCYKLVEVYNLSSLTITVGSSSNGYVGYYALDIYTSASAESKLHTVGDYIFYEDGETVYLVAYTGADADITLPDDNGKSYAINQYAFYNRDDLTSVTIPDSVESIGRDAFEDCTSLEAVYITDLAAWCEIEFVAYYSNPLAYAGKLYLNGSLITDLVIPEGITKIGERAFYGCTGLESVTIGSGVEAIGNWAFEFCYKLVEVYNLSSLTITKRDTSNGYVGYYALDIYTSASAESKLHTVGDYIFYEDGETVYLVAYTGADADITLPYDNGKSYAINQYAFYNRDDLTSVTIPDSVTSIGERAFSWCTGLESVTIGNSVETIGEDAFYGCDNLTSVTIGNRVETIGEDAFYGCTGLKSVTIGGGVSSIGSYAFDGCTALESITFLDTTTWYQTDDYYDWLNKTGGTLTDLTNPSQNATYFKSTYDDYFWYKK